MCVYVSLCASIVSVCVCLSEFVCMCVCVMCTNVHLLAPVHAQVVDREGCWLSFL